MRKKIIQLVILCCLINTNLYAIEDHIKKGDDYSWKNQYEKALLEYDIAISVNPENVIAYLRKSPIFVSKGEYDKALAACNKAIAIDPNYPKSYISKAAVLRKLGQYIDALALLNKASEKGGNDRNLYQQKAELYKETGDYQKALLNINIAIEKDEKYSFAYLTRGQIYEKIGNYGKSIFDYTKAIELRPEISNFYSFRATVYQKINKYDKAIKDLTKAIELDPDVYYFYGERGNAYKDNRMYEKAISDFTEGIKLYPNDSYLYFFRGESYLYSNKKTLALEDFNKSIELNSEYKPAYEKRRVLLQSLDSANGQEKFSSGKEFEKWLIFYYLSPEEDEIYPAINYYCNNPQIFHKANTVWPIRAFFVGATEGNDEMLDELYETINANGSEKEKAFFLDMLWLMKPQTSSRFYNKVSEEWKEKLFQDILIETKKWKHYDILELPIDSGTSLDVLWTYFFATGNEEAVKRIISVLHLQEDGNQIGIAIGGAANWSLTANTKTHKKVFEICKSEMVEQEGATKRLLEKIVENTSSFKELVTYLDEKETL